MAEDIDKLRKQYKELLDSYEKSIKDRSSFVRPDDIKSVKDLENAIEDVNNAFDTTKRISFDIGEDVSHITKEFRRIVNEATKYKDVVKNTSTIFKRFGDIGEKVLSDLRGYTDLTKDDVKKQREKVQILRQRLGLQIESLQEEKESLEKLKAKGLLEKDQEQRLKNVNNLLEESKDILDGKSVLYNQLLSSLDSIELKIKIQNKLLGFTGALAEGMVQTFNNFGLGAIPNLIGVDRALANAKEKAKEIANAEIKLTQIEAKRKELIEDTVKTQQDLSKNLSEEIKNNEKLKSDKNTMLYLSDEEYEASKDERKSLDEKIVKSDELIKKIKAQKDERAEILEAELKGLSKEEAMVRKIRSQYNAFTLALKFGLDIIKGIGEFLEDPFAGFSTAFAMVLKGFNSLNKSQMEFARETGRTVPMFDTITNSIITSSDYIKAAGALTKQMGMDATTIFSKGTLKEAAELEQLMGLSAEEFGALARMAKLSGKELKNQNTEIFKSVANFNKLNKTTISGKAILQDISKMSSTMTVNFRGNTTAMVEAAAAAKKFGLELSQIDKIADSLLNFESSISAELEAELLTGKEFNLERARFLSLNNDIEGLTKEIVNNEEVRAAFASGNRIQQENVAKMLGMQKDEIAKMIIMDAQRRGLTNEQIAQAAGMTENDYKRLSLQESINKSVEKLGEALAGPLAVLAELVSKGDALATLAKTIFKVFTLVAAIKLGMLAGQFAALIAPLFGASAGAISLASAITGGLAAIAIVAAISSMMSGVDDAVNQASASAAKAKNAGDIFSTGGNTIVSTAEGGLFKTSPNDEMIVAPGISRMLGSNTSSDTSALIAEIKALRNDMSQKKQNIVVNVENKPVVGTQQIVAGLREQYKIE